MPTSPPTPMASAHLVVPCEHGLHLQVASRIVTLAKSFQSEVWLGSQSAKIDAKSILGMLKLGAGQGTPLTVTARGPDAKQAVAAVAKLFASEPLLCGLPPRGPRSDSQ